MKKRSVEKYGLIVKYGLDFYWFKQHDRCRSIIVLLLSNRVFAIGFLFFSFIYFR